MNDNDNLKQRQAYPLELKVEMSKLRIREWHKHWHGKVYVAFSGGKDSTVLLDLVRSIYPDVPAVFADTGLEYPEIRSFVKTIPNVTWVKPKMKFKAVIEKYGYPVVSKEQALYISECQNATPNNAITRRRRLTGVNKDGVYKGKDGQISKKWRHLIDAPFKISGKCCDKIKKEPVKTYERENKSKPFIGVMAEDSRIRRKSYITYGCNAIGGKQDQSRPMMFWKEDDIWKYIKKYNVPYCKLYDMGWERTGCMFCMFGVHMEKSDLFHKNRFQRMKQTHPKLWNYCINKLGLKQVLNAIKVNYE